MVYESFLYREVLVSCYSGLLPFKAEHAQAHCGLPDCLSCQLPRQAMQYVMVRVDQSR